MTAVVLHLHPGWPFGTGTVLDAIVRDGAYRSQWSTGTSNGGLTAHPGGDRWTWESRIFDGRYDDAPAHARPVYGAWNRHGDPYGAAPRFGSAHLRLRPEVLARSTFCWPDSVFGPRDRGGPEVLPQLCELADAALHDPTLVPEEATGLSMEDPLNDYVEAHVHGEVRLADDVEAIVVDPSDLAVHRDALDALGASGVVVETHPGYVVDAERIDPAYRGPAPVDLARGLGGTRITPARLATAARSGAHDPQAVKWLWHCLARFGRQDGC